MFGVSTICKFEIVLFSFVKTKFFLQHAFFSFCCCNKMNKKLVRNFFFNFDDVR